MGRLLLQMWQVWCWQALNYVVIAYILCKPPPPKKKPLPISFERQRYTFHCSMKFITPAILPVFSNIICFFEISLAKRLNTSLSDWLFIFSISLVRQSYIGSCISRFTHSGRVKNIVFASFRLHTCCQHAVNEHNVVLGNSLMKLAFSL